MLTFHFLWPKIRPCVFSWDFVRVVLRVFVVVVLWGFLFVCLFHFVLVCTDSLLLWQQNQAKAKDRAVTHSSGFTPRQRPRQQDCF